MTNAERHARRIHVTGQKEATKLVAIAVNHGRLEPVTNFVCVDCGMPAKCYDHRDYNKPLNVEPVCIGCNVKRGKAIPVKNAGKYEKPRIKYSTNGLIECFGGIYQTAEKMGVSHQSVHLWLLQGMTRCRAEQAERLSNGNFKTVRLSNNA